MTDLPSFVLDDAGKPFGSSTVCKNSCCGTPIRIIVVGHQKVIPKDHVHTPLWLGIWSVEHEPKVACVRYYRIFIPQMTTHTSHLAVAVIRIWSTNRFVVAVGYSKMSLVTCAGRSRLFPRDHYREIIDIPSYFVTSTWPSGSTTNDRNHSPEHQSHNSRK